MQHRSLTAAPDLSLLQDGQDGDGRMPPAVVGLEVAVARTGALTTTDSDRDRNLHKEDVGGVNSGQVGGGGILAASGQREHGHKHRY